MQFLTPEVFDLLIIVVIIVGLALAAVRLYRDLTRPLPGDFEGARPPFDEDTRPHKAAHDDAGNTNTSERDDAG